MTVVPHGGWSGSGTVLDMSGGAFMLESEMLPPLLPRLRTLAGWRAGSLHTYYEVPALRGVPDLVLARFDDAAMNDWTRPAVTEYSHIATLVALAERAEAGLTTSSTRDLASHVGLSPGHLSGVVLPRLAEQGFADQSRRGRWLLTKPFESPITRLVTVELKRHDRVGALHQATAHGQGADRAWVVLDAVRLRMESARDRAILDAYESRGVGLATLSRQLGRVRVVARPCNGGAASFSKYMRRVARAVLAERVLDLQLGGGNSGPTWPVFGRTLAVRPAKDMALC